MRQKVLVHPDLIKLHSTLRIADLDYMENRGSDNAYEFADRAREAQTAFRERKAELEAAGADIWGDETPTDDVGALLKQIAALKVALEPFAEEPSARMDDYPCHKGLTTKEKCGRCGQAIAAWNALHNIDAAKSEVNYPSPEKGKPASSRPRQP